MAAGQRPRRRECHKSLLAENGAVRELALRLGQHAPPAIFSAQSLWYFKLLLRSLPFCHVGRRTGTYEEIKSETTDKDLGSHQYSIVDLQLNP